MFSKEEIIEWLNGHEQSAELKARNSLNHRKFMMFGYWKAIAVHIRRMKREIKKADSLEFEE